MENLLLAIDIGNTKTDLAVFNNKGEILFKTKANTQKNSISSELENGLMNIISKYNPAECCISSVIPEFDPILNDYFNKVSNIKLNFVEYFNCKESIDIPKPMELGADRICNILAVNTKYTVPCIVIDSGTATTFDLIDESGKYIGGVIFPGINTGMKSLASWASKLEEVEIPDKINFKYGKTTKDSIQLGIYKSQIFAIKGFLNEYKKMFSNAVTIGTGGWIEKIRNELDINFIDLNLTLYGIYYYNNKLIKN